MSTREQIVNELASLSEDQLEQVAQYLAFIKHQSRAIAIQSFDENQLAALYAESAEEDRELAEEGIPDYVVALAREDAE